MGRPTRCTRAAPERRGTSLYEILLALWMLGILAVSLVQVTRGMRGATNIGSTQALLMEQGQKALTRIMADLRSSGFRQQGGVSYPHVYENGVPDAEFAAHAHSLPVSVAEPGDADFGIQHSIVFILPSDLDGDGRPDVDTDFDGVPELDGDGDGVRTDDPGDVSGLWDLGTASLEEFTGLSWGHQEISYVVATGPDGVNVLERRQGATATGAEVVARGVQRLEIETAEDTGYQIPTNALRVTVHLRRRAADGTWLLHESQVVMVLRNGALQ